MIFEDRKAAGKQLAAKLVSYQDKNIIVVAIPRGGVPIGAELARALHAPLTVVVVRKIGAPKNEEFGIGAIGENNVLILDKILIDHLEIPKAQVAEMIKREEKEIKRRVALYHPKSSLKDTAGKIVILVDDGVATGVTAKAAIEAIKIQHPKKIIFALPVCAEETKKEMQIFVDELLCLSTPPDFMSVGMWYASFPQVSDEEVKNLLENA